MADGKLKKVNFSELTTDIISEVLRGNIFELVRNKRPYGAFLIRKPQTEDEIQALAELLRQIMLEPAPEKPKKSKSKKV